MAILPILQYPDPRLKIKAQPVGEFDDEIKRNIADLFETMYATNNCAGLAATQVNIQKRIIAIDLSANKN